MFSLVLVADLLLLVVSGEVELLHPEDLRVTLPAPLREVEICLQLPPELFLDLLLRSDLFDLEVFIFRLEFLLD